MAKDNSLKDTLIMCRLTISIAVQCENNKDTINKIQSLSDTNQHYLMKAIEQVCERGRLMYPRFSPFVGHGQSSGIWRHSWCVDDDRVHTFYSSAVRFKTEPTVPLVMTITTICNQTEVEFSQRRKPSRRSTKLFLKNTARYKPTMTMPFLRRMMRLLECDKLSGKRKIPRGTTRPITSCEQRSTGCGRSCEFFLNVWKCSR